MKKSRSVISLIAVFAAGFVAGVVFSAWKLDTTAAPSKGRSQKVKEQDGQEQLRRRIAGIEKMLAKDPSNSVALVQLGNDYFDLGNYQKAVEAYQRALKVTPRDPDILTDMGIAYRRLGNPKESVQCFRRAIAANPNHALALFNLGIVLRDDVKDYPGALKAWETFLEKAGNTPHAVMVRPWVKQLRDKVARPTSGSMKKEE